jgi:membrane protein required for colicin V production
MTSFDWIVVAVIGLSTLFAFFRGLIRELVALMAWVLGLIAAVSFTPLVGGWLPDMLGHPAVRYLIAFALIVIGALLLGALVAWPLSHAVHAAGLGFVDRFLGSIFGLARGMLVVVAFVLVAGLTSLPQTLWWQNSALALPLTGAALAVTPYLPPEWAQQLDYSQGGGMRRPPVKNEA